MPLTDSQLRRIVLEVLGESASARNQASDEVSNEVYVSESFEDDTHGEYEAEILYVRDEKKYYVTSWPHPANKKGKVYNHKTGRNEGEVPSRDNPIELTSDNFCIGDEYITQLINAISHKIPGVKTPKESSQNLDASLGYPVLVINDAKSKPVSSKLLKSLEKKIDLLPQGVGKEIAQTLYDIAPEGHGFLVVIEPGSGRPKLIDFGLWSAEAGGHAECANQPVMGSVIVRDLGGLPLKLTKTQDNTGEEYYVFENAREAIKDIFSRPGWSEQFPLSNADVTKVDNCKYSNKALSIARSTRCFPYNILPGTGIMDLLGTASPISQFYKKYIVGTEFDTELEKASKSDNCSTFAYKIVSVAKTGKASLSDKTLIRLPSRLIFAVNRDFNFV